MAAGKVFACSHCDRKIEAWDEGDPYYLDKRGKKRHACHPDPHRGLCTGLDSPVLCLNCGAESVSDSAAPIMHCPKCKAGKIMESWALDGRTCPSCKAGVFAEDPRCFMIS